MLVLSRKQEQRIQIGEHVVVTILQVKGRSVRIGIEAPAEMHIRRGELCDDDPGEVVPPAGEPTDQDTTSDPPAVRHRDRVLARRRSPAFAQRHMSDAPADGPLRRYVERRDSDRPRSTLIPPRRRDEPPQRDETARMVPLLRASGRARPRIERQVDHYLGGPALHCGVAGCGETDESPVLRALRWRA